jgi:hypothetical protein
MANPQVPQGNLNRVRASVTFPSNPALTVTAPFLSPAGISMRFESPVSEQLDTMTGLVGSPAPYQSVTVVMHLLRSQVLAGAYKSQIELNALVGNMTVRPDSVTLPDYSLVNCAITTGPEGLDFNGKAPDFTITITGAYQINSSLYSA